MKTSKLTLNRLSVAVLSVMASAPLLALQSASTGVVHGHQIEVQGAPVIAGSPYAQQQLSVTILPTATDADSTDSHTGWRYVWQVAGADVASEQDAGSISVIPPFTVRPGDKDKGVRVCLKAIASAGFPVGTQLSTVVCSNEVTILDSAPVANDVAISGELEKGQILTGGYQFADADGDVESGSTYQWFRASDAAGTNKMAVVGSDKTYQLRNDDGGRYMVLEITPKSASGASSTGELVRVVSGQVSTDRGRVGNFSAPSETALEWASAVNYCNNLIRYGYSDWRLPSIDELVALYNMVPDNGLSTVYGWFISYPIHFWSMDERSPGSYHQLNLRDGVYSWGFPSLGTTAGVTCVR